MNNHSEETQAHAIELWQNGKSDLEINKETKIARSTIYRWINDFKNQPLKPNQLSQHAINLLENKVKRLEGIIEIIKKQVVPLPLRLKKS